MTSEPPPSDENQTRSTRQYALSCTPTKKPCKAELPTSERQHNRLLAQVRVKVEHVIRRLKIFRILAERYCNQRRCFGLRLNLIAAVVNFELRLRA